MSRNRFYASRLAQIYASRLAQKKGFISLPMAGAAVAVAVIAVLGISLKVQSARLANAKEAHEQVKAEFAGFRLEVERIGKEAQAKAQAKEADDKAAKEKSDAKHKATVSELTAMYRGLRDQRAGSGSNVLPEASRTSGVPVGVICFNRQALDSGLRNAMDESAKGFERGDRYRLDLACGAEWATRREVK